MIHVGQSTRRPRGRALSLRRDDRQRESFRSIVKHDYEEGHRALDGSASCFSFSVSLPPSSRDLRAGGWSSGPEGSSAAGQSTADLTSSAPDRRENLKRSYKRNKFTTVIGEPRQSSRCFRARPEVIPTYMTAGVIGAVLCFRLVSETQQPMVERNATRG